jgi:small subunit ribosomal protein S9
MADEPQDNATSEEQEEVPAKDEGVAPAGPVAEGDPPAHPPEGQPSTPPAEDASEGESPAADASEEKEKEEAPAADASEEEEESPAADASGEDAADAKEEEPPKAEDGAVSEREGEKSEGKEKKKDVIPGADLEPIAVEPEEKPLSAEERARREAEEEERARREAALTGESEEEPRAKKRAPAKMEGDSRFLATGKRKRSVARVTLLPGSGKIEINKRPLDEFFPRPLHQTMALQPLATTGYEGNVDVRVRVHGGGISGQAGAVRHGIARALTEVDPELRGELKRRGFLTRDARVKERRKAGLKKARKRPQFSKR